MPAPSSSQTSWAFGMTTSCSGKKDRVGEELLEECLVGRVGGGGAGGGQTQGGYRYRCADELGDVVAGQDHGDSLVEPKRNPKPHAD